MDSVTSSELTELEAVYLLRPYGPERADLHAGTLASLVYNRHRKKGAKAMGAADWFGELPPPAKRRPRQTAAQQAQIARAWTIALGGRVIEPGK
jgi:hypothetical protein